MDTIQNFTHTPNPQDFQKSSSSSISENGFPIMAMAVLGISFIAFLLVSYYIFVTKCCFRCQQLDSLRRFPGDRENLNEDRSMAYSPSWQTRGLDELLIQEIPSFKYIRSDLESNSLLKCVVCLNEFQEHDMLRILPKCNHGFHLDCIDLWLQSNSNCPLCRSTIAGRNQCPLDRIMAPTSSPQNPQQLIDSIVTDDFVMIEVSEETVTGRQHERNESRTILVQSGSHSSRKFEPKNGKFKPRKSHHVSAMGDESIDVRGKDDQFSVQSIRRSFSMDSAVDHQIYLSVQEIVRHNRHHSEVSNNEESSNRSRKPIFSFGQGRGPRNAVLPIEF